MAKNAMDFRPEEENVAYIGAGVTLKGEISASDLIIVDGAIKKKSPRASFRWGRAASSAARSAPRKPTSAAGFPIISRSSSCSSCAPPGRVEGKITYGEIGAGKEIVIAGELTAIEDYRAAKAAPAAKPAAERVEIAGAPPKPSSIDRINEAVRGGKGAWARSISPPPAMRSASRRARCSAAKLQRAGEAELFARPLARRAPAVYRTLLPAPFV